MIIFTKNKSFLSLLRKNQMTKIIMLSLVCINLFANKADDGLIEYNKGNKVLASKLYKKACESGNMIGCIRLGSLYVDGDGIKQSHKKAKKLFKRACKERHVTACYALGNLYKNGEGGIKRSIGKAKNFFAYGCRRGHEPSCKQYNLIREKPETTGSGKNVINSGYTYSPQIYGG